MNILTKDNFNEFISGEVVVTFASKSGCKFCTDFKPVYKKFAEETPNVKCGLYEREQVMQEADEIEKKYNINAFPTVLHFKNGEVLGKLETYMFMGEQELVGHVLDQEIEYAKRKKSLFDMQVRIEGMKAYMKAKPMFIEEEKDKAPTLEAVLPEVKKPIDLSGFPEGQSPDGGGCEGCGDSQQ